MPPLLPELLQGGLIEKLDGDDQRYIKLEKAAETLAHDFREKPAVLIRAVLAALDPEIPPHDPAVQQAKQALQREWKTMAGVYADEPVGLYRAVLLEACHQCGEGENAAILWLTSADTLPLHRLGSEEAVVAKALKAIAVRAEEDVMAKMGVPQTHFTTSQESEDVSSTLAQREVDRDELTLRIGEAAGPNHRGNAGRNPNPHFSNQGQAWCWEFTDRMASLLADELDALAAEMAEGQNDLAGRVSTLLKAQQQWVASALTGHEARSCTEQLRLDALWWSEALYSPSLQCGYRDLPAAIASVVMAADLLEMISLPTPASVGHLLAETVNRLPGAGYEEKQPISKLLSSLRELRASLGEGWSEKFSPPPSDGRLSLRDLLVLALGDKEWNISHALARTGISGEFEISLPGLAHALFRQEQAVRLAEQGT